MPSRRLTLFAACFAFALVLRAQAVITWLETDHDFGVFPEEMKQVTAEMKFVNSGDSALIIKQVRPTCGCTAGEYPHNPVMPGDTAAVTLTYSSIGRPGQFEKQVFVYANTMPAKSVLTIRGKVIGSKATISRQYPVEAGDLHLKNSVLPVGEIYSGTTRMGYITAYNTASSPLALRFADAPPHIVTSAVPDTVQPGSTTTLTIHYDAHAAPLWGLNSDEVTLVVQSADGSEARFPITVTAVKVEDFSQLTSEERRNAPVAELSDAKITFDNLPSTGMVKGTVTLKNTGNSDLLVRRVIPNDKAVTASVSDKVKRGKSATLAVTVDAVAVTGEVLNTSVTIITNDPTNPVIELRVAGVKK